MSESVDPQISQRLEAIKRATANALATVVVGRGRLQAARTVRAHVQAAILLIGLEQRAAYILHMGNYAAGVLQTMTPQPAPRSDTEQIVADVREFTESMVADAKQLPSKHLYYVDEAAFEDPKQHQSA